MRETIGGSTEDSRRTTGRSRITRDEDEHLPVCALRGKELGLTDLREGESRLGREDGGPPDAPERAGHEDRIRGAGSQALLEELRAGDGDASIKRILSVVVAKHRDAVARVGG